MFNFLKSLEKKDFIAILVLALSIIGYFALSGSTSAEQAAIDAVKLKYEQSTATAEAAQRSLDSIRKAETAAKKAACTAQKQVARDGLALAHLGALNAQDEEKYKNILNNWACEEEKSEAKPAPVPQS